MRYILLDTNIIIGAFDSTDKSNPQHQNAKQIIRDGHVHDVGGGDLAVTTCEAFEGLDAFLKHHFPDPLGELTETERKWFKEKAFASVPDGYALVPIGPTEEMLAAGQQEWLDSAGADPSFDIYRAMLAASQKP